jgi:peptide deformylase
VDLTQSIAGYSDLEKFERSMVNLMIASRGIGLAANQIGITKRFFVIGYESFDVFTKPVILWNPSIVRSSEEIVEDVEGCLSFPGIWVKVKRPKQVTVRWQNLKGETLMQHLDGIESKCFQHELDHIDGITFNTRVSKLKWDMAKKKAYR